jgi:hypothetical protein
MQQVSHDFGTQETGCRNFFTASEGSGLYPVGRSLYPDVATPYPEGRSIYPVVATSYPRVARSIPEGGSPCAGVEASIFRGGSPCAAEATSIPQGRSLTAALATSIPAVAARPGSRGVEGRRPPTGRRTLCGPIISGLAFQQVLGREADLNRIGKWLIVHGMRPDFGGSVAGLFICISRLVPDPKRLIHPRHAPAPRLLGPQAPEDKSSSIYLRAKGNWSIRT